MVPLVSLNIHKIAKPIEDSVAAIVNMKITNICPIISSRYIENDRKFKLEDNSINSIAIIIIITLFLFKLSPNIPMKNRVDVNFNMS